MNSHILSIAKKLVEYYNLTTMDILAPSKIELFMTKFDSSETIFKQKIINYEQLNIADLNAIAKMRDYNQFGIMITFNDFVHFENNTMTDLYLTTHKEEFKIDFLGTEVQFKNAEQARLFTLRIYDALLKELSFNYSRLYQSKRLQNG